MITPHSKPTLPSSKTRSLWPRGGHLLRALVLGVLIALFLPTGRVHGSEAALRKEIEAFFERYNREVFSKEGGYEQTIAWMQAQSFPTARYQAALAKLYRDALAKDPEYGYGADAVICGQDYPSNGCRVGQLYIEGDVALASLTSRDPVHQHLFYIRLVREKEQWRLDGTGDLTGGVFEELAGKPSDEALTKGLVGTWKSPQHTYRYDADGSWRPAATPGGKWKIHKGKLLQGKEAPKTILLLTPSALYFTEEDAPAFHRLEKRP